MIKISVKAKLIILMLSTSILPIIVLGGFSYIESYKALNQSAVDAIRAKSEGVADSTQTAMDDAAGLLQNLATSPTVVNLLNSYKNDPRGTYLQNQAETFRYLRKIYVDFDGKFSNVMVTDQNGLVAADSWNGKYVGRSVRNQDYFQQALQKRQLSVGGAVLARESSTTSVKLPNISLAYPVIDAGGRPLGTVIISYELGYFSRHLYLEHFGSSGFGVLLDQKGLVLYHPDANQLLKKTQSPVLNKLVADFQRNGLKPEGTLRTTIDNESYLVVFRVVPTPRWIIAVLVPESDYLAAAHRIRTSALVIVLLCIFATVTNGFFAVGNLTRSIRQIVSLIKGVENGDFSIKAAITTRDEFSELSTSFNRMIEGQNYALQHISETAKNVETVAVRLDKAVSASGTEMKEIAGTTRQVSQAALKNKSEINNLQAVMEQIVEKTRLIMESTNLAAENYSEATKTACAGKQSVLKAMDSMLEINRNTKDMSQSVELLFGTIKEALGFVKIVEDVANQTHLLALNASIEAARAGENGRTFSIVAHEVKKLADQSSQAAKEIHAKIKNLKEKEELLNQRVYAVNLSVESGTKLAGETVSSLQTITGSVQQNDHLMTAILASVEEQFASVEDISGTISRMADATKETSLWSEEIARKTESQSVILRDMNANSLELSRFSQALYNLVLQYKLLENPQIAPDQDFMVRTMTQANSASVV